MKDSDVLAGVRRRLQGSSHKRLAILVTPSIENKEVVLRGIVPSFYLKQVAQAVLRGSTNGYAINNLLEVKIQE